MTRERSAEPKTKCPQSPEHGEKRLSEAEPEPEMQASQDEVLVPGVEHAPGTPAQLSPEAAAPLSNHAANCIERQAPSEKEEEDLYLSDLEGMLETEDASRTGALPSDAAEPASWPVLQTPAASSRNWPEPEGEAAELLATLRSVAELLNPGDYWLADSGTWDIEALREDAAMQQDSVKDREASAGLEGASGVSAPEPASVPSEPRAIKRESSSEMSISPAGTPYVVRLSQWRARKQARRKRLRDSVQNDSTIVEAQGPSAHQETAESLASSQLPTT